jgi:hypothetical protein
MGSLVSLLSWIIWKGNDLLLAVDGTEDDLKDTSLSRSSMVQNKLFSQFQSAGALKMVIIFTFPVSKIPPVRKTLLP